MPVVRKVQSKVTLPARRVSKPFVEKEITLEESEARGRSFNQEGIRTKKACFFCKGRMEPHYFDSASLRKFVSDRGKILPRGRSGACAKHQRRVSREIKRARLLALLPFTPSI